MSLDRLRGWLSRLLRNTDVVAVAAMVLLWMAFFWRYLTPDPSSRVLFPQGDFTHHYYVYRSFAFSEYQAGRFPGWMPCVFAGYPFQADPQSALFYPPAALNIMASMALGFDHLPLSAFHVEAIAHFLIASLLGYAFLRTHFDRSTWPLMGSLVYTYGGYLTGYPPLQIAILEGSVWLPLALLGVRLFHLRSEWWPLLVAVLGLSLSVLAGNPQTFTYVTYLTLAYHLFLGVRGGLRFSRILLVGAGIMVWTAGLTAIQLIPSAEYATLSTRASIPFEEAATGFPPQDVIQLVLTGVVSHWQPLYVGILPLLLATLAVGRHRDRGEVLFWAGAAVVGFLLSFGQNLFGFDLAYLLVPGYQLFRSQERHALIFSFAMSMLSAYGASWLWGTHSRRDRVWLSRTRAFLFRLIPWVFAGVVAAVLIDRAGQDFSDSGQLPERTAMAFMLILGSLVILSIRRWAPRWRQSSILGLSLVVIDLFTLNRPVNFASPYELFPVTPLLSNIVADQGLYRIQDDFRLPGHTACMIGAKEVGGIASIRLDHVQSFLDSVPEVVRLRLLAVKYLITWRMGLDPAQVNAELVYSEGDSPEDSHLYRLDSDPPWAFVIRDIETVPDRSALHEYLSQPGFDPFRTAVMEVSGDGADVPAFSAPATVADEVRVISYTPNRVVVQASLDAPGLLVVSDAIYPGWRARVDGRHVTIQEAYGILRAVPLSAGTHSIVFSYDPWAPKMGAAVSGLTLLSTVMGIVWLSRRRARVNATDRADRILD